MPISNRVKSNLLPIETQLDWRQAYPFDSHFFTLSQAIENRYRSAVGSNESSRPRLHYVDQRDSGPQGDQNPILMVHGNPTWSFYWRGLIRALQPNHRVVAIDHLGCGLSDKPNDFDYCLQSHIENLCGLVDELDLKNITLVAHDWGGAIGLGTLLACKSRFKQIILFNTGAYRPHFIPFRIRVCRWPWIGTLGVRGLNLFARAATVMATEQKGGLPKPTASGLLFPYDNWQNRIAIDRFVKDIPLSPSHRTWKVLQSIEESLNDLADWPILMIWGMKDWCFRPDCLRRFQQHWPNAEVVEIDDAGHYVVEDAPELVETHVRQFLAKNIK